MRMRGNVYIVIIIYLILNIKSYGLAGHIIYDTPIVIFIGILFLSQQSRFVSEKHSTYIIVSLGALIVFNIILVRMTGNFVGESLIVIVALFWLYSQNERNRRLERELGIDGTAIKRALLK
jgi:formate/nitrite transporter FocA (FNT family)